MHACPVPSVPIPPESHRNPQTSVKAQKHSAEHATPCFCVWQPLLMRATTCGNAVTCSFELAYSSGPQPFCICSLAEYFSRCPRPSRRAGSFFLVRASCAHMCAPALAHLFPPAISITTDTKMVTMGCRVKCVRPHGHAPFSNFVSSVAWYLPARSPVPVCGWGPLVYSVFADLPTEYVKGYMFSLWGEDEEPEPTCVPLSLPPFVCYILSCLMLG